MLPSKLILIAIDCVCVCVAQCTHCVAAAAS